MGYWHFRICEKKQCPFQFCTAVASGLDSESWQYDEDLAEISAGFFHGFVMKISVVNMFYENITDIILSRCRQNKIQVVEYFLSSGRILWYTCIFSSFSVLRTRYLKNRFLTGQSSSRLWSQMHRSYGRQQLLVNFGLLVTVSMSAEKRKDNPLLFYLKFFVLNFSNTFFLR